MTRIAFIVLGYCLLIRLFSGCSNDTYDPQPASRGYCLDERFANEIAWVTPVMQPFTEGVHLTGSVESNPDKVFHFISLVGGIISGTHFSLGDRVVKGQVLAELRSTELTEWHAASTTIESRILVAERALQAAERMYQDGIASQTQLAEAQTGLEILKAERERINANMQLFSASREKGVFQIKAPANGIITSKSITPGAQVSAGGEPLFTVSDLSDVWVMVNVYASHVRHITTGMDVHITTLSYPGEAFSGKIGALSQVLDPEAKVLKARVVLKNAGLKLKPGMMVDVTALRRGGTEALTIPTGALLFDNNQHFAVVYQNNCELEIRKVDILSSRNDTTFIAGGLSDSDKIVTKNQLLIYEQIKNFQN